MGIVSQPILIVSQFSRTIAPYQSKGHALILAIKYYNWQKTIILTTTAEPWLPAALELTKELRAATIEVSRPAAFEPGNFKNATLIEVEDF